MNKRQYKKARKKINKVCILDELFLLDFTPEEFQNYLEDVEEYSFRHYRYKHYKERKTGVIDFSYRPPVSKRYSEHDGKILKYARKFPLAHILIQN